MKTVLIVEDDPAISDLIAEVLTAGGIQPIRAYSGSEALLVLQRRHPDLILLDLMLPGISGEAVMERVPDIPVIIVSARGEIDDKVDLLRSGAADYITKPFEMMELLARVESVLRRTGRKNSVLKFQNLTIDEDQRQVYGPAGVIELTPKEFDLFVFLIRNRNIALYREEILEKVWHDDYEGTTRTVDMHIASLRKKLGLNRQIVSVYKIGYRLEDRS